MKGSFVAVAAAMTLAVSVPGFAAAADSNPAHVQAGAYKVEPRHTRVLFAVNHLGFNDYYGEFTETSGTLVLNPNNLAASKLDVTLAVKSVSTTNATLDGELRSADWFDADKFPTIRFVSTKVTRTGPSTADVAGDLTLHGVARPVVLKAVLGGAGANPMNKVYTVGFHARGKIKRSDFGVKAYVPMIGDEVELIISAAFEKQPG